MPTGTIATGTNQSQARLSSVLPPTAHTAHGLGSQSCRPHRHPLQHLVKAVVTSRTTSFQHVREVTIHTSNTRAREQPQTTTSRRDDRTAYGYHATPG
jgi:hypothetical protein